jgi:purine-binding chemotaxis protein CheW
VIQLDGVTLGFLVDAATAVMKVPGDAIEPPPEMMGDIQADYLDGVAKLEGRLAILLNLKKVLSTPQVVAATAEPTPAEPVGAERNG